MLEHIICSEDMLAGHKLAVLACANRDNIELNVDINESHYADSYIYYMLFTYWPELVHLDSTDVTVLYNRYFYFKKFAILYQSAHGRDVGFDQQAFGILETAIEELDWTVIEAISKQLEGG